MLVKKGNWKKNWGDPYKGNWSSLSLGHSTIYNWSLPSQLWSRLTHGNMKRCLCCWYTVHFSYSGSPYWHLCTKLFIFWFVFQHCIWSTKCLLQYLTLSHAEALPWRAKSSGVRQSKITKGPVNTWVKHTYM